MSKVVKRGYFPSDEIEFSDIAIAKLQKAASDLSYLVNRGYKIKGASVFVGNHYMLSQRQRLALVRGVTSEESMHKREKKELKRGIADCVIHVDGFNTIITLEVAFSGSPLLKCMDGTIRDLAGLRGTYRLIDKTELAIMEIGKFFEKEKVKEVVFYLDAPISNSGKLSQKIKEVLTPFSFEMQVRIISNVDSVLESLENVVTSDAIILDKCTSWLNLNQKIIDDKIGTKSYIDLSLDHKSAGRK